jgi:hypothetical protein
MVSRCIIAVLALIPTSSRLRTFTERLSSSSWPATIRTQSVFDVPVNAWQNRKMERVSTFETRI